MTGPHLLFGALVAIGGVCFALPLLLAAIDRWALRPTDRTWLREDRHLRAGGDPQGARRG